MNKRVDLFRATDLFDMDMRPSEKARLEKHPNVFLHAAAMEQYGTGGTLVIDDVKIACLGYIPLWPGCYEVWAFPSVHVEKFAMVYLRTVKRYIKAIEETHNPSRLQTATVDNPQHNAWMRFLGFQNETPGGMVNYSSLGETFNMWSIIYPGT